MISWTTVIYHINKILSQWSTLYGVCSPLNDILKFIQTYNINFMGRRGKCLIVLIEI